MLTESFIDSSYSIILNENIKVKRNKILYRDILDILHFYRKQQNNEIPISFKPKFEFLENFCKLKIETSKSDNDIIDSMTYFEKYKSLKDFVEKKKTDVIDDVVFNSHVHQLRLRKKLNGLLRNYRQIESFMDTIRDGSFDSIDTAIGDYESLVKTMYTSIMEHNRIVQVEATSSLDLSKDSYDNVLDSIVNKYSEKSIIPSGIPIFDNEIFLNHGLESSRLYIFSGGSGSGKSTIMNNIITNSITKRKNMMVDKTTNKKNVYVYITLENQIDEAFLRTYQPIFNKTTKETIKEINMNVDLKSKLKEHLDEAHAHIIMKYFPAMSISTIDIGMVLDEVISEYGEGSIAVLVIDYLDLLRSDTKYDAYRLELGHITLSLKTLAVQYNIPIITASQLNREIYKVQSAENLNLGQIGESAKKIDHSDFIALLVKDPVDDTVVHCKIGKNRSGRSGVEIDFNVDFSKYKFCSGNLVRSKASSFNGTKMLDEQLFDNDSTDKQTLGSNLFS